MLILSTALGLALTGPAAALTVDAARSEAKAASTQKAAGGLRLGTWPTRANLTSYTTKASAKQPVYIYQAPRAVKPLKTW
jgi:hypothetical protein